MSEGPFYIEPSITDIMRDRLKPGGTAPIVGLKTAPYGLWLNHSFVESCIDELEKMPIRAELGQPPTNLEKLAYMLLCDSAYIESKK